MTKLEVLERIVRDHQYEQIRWLDSKGKSRKLIIDTTTANAILTVYRALKPENQAKFLAFGWPKMADTAWKLLT